MKWILTDSKLPEGNKELLLYYAKDQIYLGTFIEERWSKAILTIAVTDEAETPPFPAYHWQHGIAKPFCWCYIKDIDLPLSENLLRQKKPLEMKSYYIIKKIKKQNGSLLNNSSYYKNYQYNRGRIWGKIEESSHFNSKEEAEDKIENLIANKYIKDLSYVKIFQVNITLIDMDDIDDINNQLEDIDEEKKIDRFSLIDME